MGTGNEINDQEGLLVEFVLSGVNMRMRWAETERSFAAAGIAALLLSSSRLLQVSSSLSHANLLTISFH